jgi:hypothetical protein
MWPVFTNSLICRSLKTRVVGKRRGQRIFRRWLTLAELRVHLQSALYGSPPLSQDWEWQPVKSSCDNEMCVRLSLHFRAPMESTIQESRRLDRLCKYSSGTNRSVQIRIPGLSVYQSQSACQMTLQTSSNQVGHQPAATQCPLQAAGRDFSKVGRL